MRHSAKELQVSWVWNTAFRLRCLARAKARTPNLRHQDAARTLPDEQGFSLLELILVLLVMGLAVAVTYPALSRGTASLHLRSAGRDVINCLRFARERAITEQVGMRVVIDREAQKLVMTDETGAGSRAFALPPDVQIRRMVVSGREILEGPLEMHFLPNGSSSSAELLLVSNKGAVIRIVSDPITGAARMFADSREGQP